MKLQIEATEQLTTIDGVPVRLWEGDHRERCLQVERLAHRIDLDVHDHLKEVSSRLVVLEGWADSRDRNEHTERQELDAVLRSYSEALDKIRSDLERLKPQPGTSAKPNVRGGR